MSEICCEMKKLLCKFEQLCQLQFKGIDLTINGLPSKNYSLSTAIIVPSVACFDEAGPCSSPEEACGGGEGGDDEVYNYDNQDEKYNLLIKDNPDLCLEVKVHIFRIPSDLLDSNEKATTIIDKCSLMEEKMFHEINSNTCKMYSKLNERTKLIHPHLFGLPFDSSDLSMDYLQPSIDGLTDEQFLEYLEDLPSSPALYCEEEEEEEEDDNDDNNLA